MAVDHAVQQFEDLFALVAPAVPDDRDLKPVIAGDPDCFNEMRRVVIRWNAGNDDITARRLADDHGVPVTGSVGLPVLGIQRGSGNWFVNGFEMAN